MEGGVGSRAVFSRVLVVTFSTSTYKPHTTTPRTFTLNGRFSFFVIGLVCFLWYVAASVVCYVCLWSVVVCSLYVVVFL